MQVGSQIRKYRTELELTQDELAEKAYVSRQTISNWENDKNYPDIKSLLLLSDIFQVSLDILVKGDIEMMKEEIQRVDFSDEERVKYDKVSGKFAKLCLLLLITLIPLVYFLREEVAVGAKVAYFAAVIIVYVVVMVYAFRVEKWHKHFDISTYKEVISFMEGNTLDETEKIRESGKRPYQNVLKALCGMLVGVVVVWISILIFS